MGVPMGNSRVFGMVFPMELQGYFSVLSIFPMFLKGISRVINASFYCVSRMFQGCD